MNKMNNIFKKIAELEKNANEVKLGKHEVELNLVDDLKTSISKVSSLDSIVNTMSSNADKTNK